MRFKTFLLEETEQNSYKVSIDDGTSYTVKGDSAGAVRSAERTKLRNGQRITDIKRDAAQSKDLEAKSSELRGYITNSRKLKKDTAATSRLLRKLDRAKTNKAINAVSSEVNSYLAEGGDGSGRPSTGKRPKNSLWYGSPYHWYGDLHNHHGASDNKDLEVVDVSGSAVSMGGGDGGGGAEGEEQTVDTDLYMVDKKRENCYGTWRKGLKKGITYEKPRPFSAVKKSTAL